MNPGCPSDLALEEYLIDPALNDSAAHIAHCPLCATRLEGMEDMNQLFRRTVRPMTLDSILRETARPARRWLRWLAPALTIPALAAAAVMVAPREVIHTKGTVSPQPGVVPPSPLVFSVFAASDGRGQPAPDGAEVPASAQLRFRAEAATPCWLTVASVDATGTISHLYPEGAPAKALTPGTSMLPGGAILDGVAGPERIFAVCTEQPVQPSVLEHSLRAAVNPSDIVKAPASLPELPPGALQTTLLLKKVR